MSDKNQQSDQVLFYRDLYIQEKGIKENMLKNNAVMKDLLIRAYYNFVFISIILEFFLISGFFATFIFDIPKYSKVLITFIFLFLFVQIGKGIIKFLKCADSIREETEFNE